MTFQPKRSWLPRIGLKWFFVAVLVACAYFAGWNRGESRIRKAEERAAKAEALAEKMHRYGHSAWLRPDGYLASDQPICKDYLQVKAIVGQMTAESAGP